MTNDAQTSNMSDDNKDDSNMSPDERLAWLRERGVQVVTPDERKAGNVLEALREAEALSASATDISYVLVPADPSQPLQERTAACPEGWKEGDFLQTHLKAAFTDGTVDVGLLGQQTHTLASSGAPMPSDSTLQQVAEQGHVEVFPLVHASERNQFTGIHVYLDEVGMLKRLPLNRRVMEYAQKAGYNPSPQFYGDVYLGRVKTTRTGGVQHLPFVLGLDTQMDAPWLEFAAADNLEYQREMNQVTGRQGELQPSVDGANGVAKQETDFAWTQTEDELEVVVALPPTVTSKQLEVQFRPQSLQVMAQARVLVQLQLFEKVDVDGCTWTIDRNESEPKLVITMEKVEQALWPRVRD